MPQMFFLLFTAFLIPPVSATPERCDDILGNARTPLSKLKSEIQMTLSSGPALKNESTKEVRKVLAAARKSHLTRDEWMQVKAHIANIVSHKYRSNPEAELPMLQWLNHQIKNSRIPRENADREFALLKIMDICSDRLEDYLDQLQDFDEDDQDSNAYKKIRREMRAYIEIKNQAAELL